MPYDEAVVRTRIDKLGKIEALKSSARIEKEELEKLLDVEKTPRIPERQEQDKEADGTPKVDASGDAIMKTIPAVNAVMRKPMDHGTEITDAERDRISAHHLGIADKIIADAKAI